MESSYQSLFIGNKVSPQSGQVARIWMQTIHLHYWILTYVRIECLLFTLRQTASRDDNTYIRLQFRSLFLLSIVIKSWSSLWWKHFLFFLTTTMWFDRFWVLIFTWALNFGCTWLIASVHICYSWIPVG